MAFDSLLRWLPHMSLLGMLLAAKLQSLSANSAPPKIRNAYPKNRIPIHI
jgi:hypothetical protein